jgi:hypothetical protein
VRKRTQQDCDSRSPLERISLWGIKLRQWVGRQVRRFLRPGSAVIALIAAIYGVLEIFRVEDFPKAGFWSPGHPLVWALVVTAGAAAAGTLLVFLGFDRVLQRTGQDDEFVEACKGVWQLAVEDLDLPMDKVGVHVWTVKGFKGFRYLARRTTFVIKPRRRTAHHIIWCKGKGAVGIAWAEDDGILANVENLEARAPSEELFCEIDRRERFGLEWREFKRSKHYRAVLAVPLRVRGHVKGCLSVDIQVDGRAGDLERLAANDQFNDVLRVCEAVLESGSLSRGRS